MVNEPGRMWRPTIQKPIVGPMSRADLDTALENGLKGHVCANPAEHEHVILLRCTLCSQAASLVSYKDGILLLECASCGEPVTAIALAKGAPNV